MMWKSLFQRLANKVRGLANKAFDAAFIVKSPANLQGHVVILHGATCSGKTTILRQLRRRYAGCTFMEADDVKYWKSEGDPDDLNVALNLLRDAGVETDKARALVRSMEEFSRLPDMEYSPYKVMVELLKTCLASDAVIATCGNLPPPHGDCGYYQLLAQCSGKTMSHVLIAPDKAALAKRIRSRDQTAEMDIIIAENDWWMQHREHYDLFLTGNESPATMLELMRASIRESRAPMRSDTLN